MVKVKSESVSCSLVSNCCDPVDWSPPGSSVHGILQAGILEWVAIPFSRGSSRPRDWTRISYIAGRFLTIWATREELLLNLLVWCGILVICFIKEPISFRESYSIFLVEMLLCLRSASQQSSGVYECRWACSWKKTGPRADNCWAWLMATEGLVIFVFLLFYFWNL